MTVNFYAIQHNYVTSMFSCIAREQLQLSAETVNVWTENGGFLVDKDDILMHLMDELLMILAHGQW